MKLADNIKKLIADLRIFDIDTTTEMDQRILNDALQTQQQLKQKKLTNTQLNMWRTIMNKPVTKLTTIAAVILIAVLSITLLDKAATPAWAIEDTVELLAKYNGIYFKGTLLNEEGKMVSFEAWAIANEDQTESNHLRIESETGEIEVVSGNQRYQYAPATNIVKITKSYGAAVKPWPGPDFFESLRKTVLDWNETFAKDPATNRERVFVTCSHPAAPTPRSWWFEFDVESKLPVSIKQWDNMKMQGQPSFDVKSIIFFENLPDELFNFEIPEGAEVVSALAERDEKLRDPNSGMLLGDMTEDQASEEIAKRYWQAVIQGNWQTVAMLYPVSTAEEWENKYSGSNMEEIIKIKEPYQESGCAIVPCLIRFENNATTIINMAVKFRNIDNQQSCVIVNTWTRD